MQDKRYEATNRPERQIPLPLNREGNPTKVSEIFGENTFDFRIAEEIPENIRKELVDVARNNKNLSKEQADVVARAAMNWALAKGATHFCHWFQPLTGVTAEKHDAFIDFKNGQYIENLSASQLMQGEPDASSFPNGGSRSTFEARGYTSWDLTSPLFVMEGTNGKTLCIPTAFVSYTGDALDMKTPLLRSELKLSEAAVNFANAAGYEDVARVSSSCGPEQEYFLVDKAFYFARPDLLMTGRTLIGAGSPKNQQLDDHYFGDIPERVMSMMQELDLELHRLGIPSKTRHNEVAPGQYEMAPIYQSTNLAADSNQIVMAIISKVSKKHSFVALFHEKPFLGINGSGKHLNWSMATNTGVNLLNPGPNPAENHLFLGTLACVLEALYRHGDMVRASITSAGNDHRLGANEAPPSIISAYIGDRLKEICDSIISGDKISPESAKDVDPGAKQLAALDKDNTDRNRTSPFAFTGNRFELRACGSDAAIGLPLSVLNAAVSEVFNESADCIKKEIKGGLTPEAALKKLTKKWLISSEKVVFNGDGYSDAWVIEAEKRGLPNLRNTPAALPLLIDKKSNEFLRATGVFTESELETRYNVAIERYCTKREIEFHTLIDMVYHYVIPAVMKYKKDITETVVSQTTIGLDSEFEMGLLKKIDGHQLTVMRELSLLQAAIAELPENHQKRAEEISNQLLTHNDRIADATNELERLVSDECWKLPTQIDMLFMR